MKRTLKILAFFLLFRALWHRIRRSVRLSAVFAAGLLLAAGCASVDAEGRLRNLRRAFCVPPRLAPQIADRTILLIDDVFTTGATLSAAAEVLLASGAREIAVATIARA